RRDLDLPAGLGGAGLAQQVTRAVAAARGVGGPAGPVHVNIGFRDPLVPDGPWREASGPPPEPATRVLGRGGAPRGRHMLMPGPATVVLAGDGAGGEAADVAAAARLPLLA